MTRKAYLKQYREDNKVKTREYMKEYMQKRRLKQREDRLQEQRDNPKAPLIVNKSRQYLVRIKQWQIQKL